jgi:undecaprenol kinase
MRLRRIILYGYRRTHSTNCPRAEQNGGLVRLQIEGRLVNPENSDSSPANRLAKRTWTAKFADTLRGVRFALQEKSFRVHLAFAALVTVLACLTEVSPTDWLWLIIAIGLVLVTEIINTSIERLAQVVTTEHHPLIGQALDLAAAAVLLATTVAIIIGIVILGPAMLTWLVAFV